MKRGLENGSTSQEARFKCFSHVPFRHCRHPRLSSFSGTVVATEGHRVLAGVAADLSQAQWSTLNVGCRVQTSILSHGSPWVRKWVLFWLQVQTAEGTMAEYSYLGLSVLVPVCDIDEMAGKGGGLCPLNQRALSPFPALPASVSRYLTLENLADNLR